MLFTASASGACRWLWSILVQETARRSSGPKLLFCNSFDQESASCFLQSIGPGRFKLLRDKEVPRLNPNIIGACFSKYYALVNHAWYRYMQPPCLVGVMRVQPSGRFPIIVSTAIANTNCTIETMVDYNIYLGMILCYVVHIF